MGKIRATMMECDNPGCGAQELHSKEDPAPGYHLGKGFWVEGGGGPIPATYACSKPCILPALLSMMDQAL